MAEKKERVELQFNMNNEAEKEIIDFVDNNGTTRAGFIKSIIRQYMNAMQSLEQNVTQQAKKENPVPKKPSKRKIPKLGSSFSSKDFE